jgi:hypothetical protein
VKLKALASWIFLSFTSFWRITTLPHDKLKTRLKETIHKAFSHRNYGSKFVVLGYNSTYFSNTIHKGKTCYSEEQVIFKIHMWFMPLREWTVSQYFCCPSFTADRIFVRWIITSNA